MIIEIPDELAKKYVEKYPDRVNSLQQVFAKAIESGVNAAVKDGEPVFTLTGENLKKVRDIIGNVATPEELVSKIRRLGIVRVQGKEYFLSQDQITRIKQEAFFHTLTNEPHTEAQATPEQAKKIVNRYLEKQLDYWMNQMTSQI